MIQCSCLNKSLKESDYMAHTDYMKNDFIEIDVKKLIMLILKFFHGYLIYIPKFCSKCGCINTPHDEAMYMYDAMPKGTKVLVME